VRWLFAAVFALFFVIWVMWAELANAQPAAPQATSPPAPAAPAKPPPSRAAALAQMLNPAEYGTAFYTGAQAEFVVPDVGASALLLGYDAVWMQVDLSLGMGIGGDPVTNEDADDVYSASLRLYLPLHRGIRADYALLVAGGPTLIHPASGSTFTIGNAGVGARFRVFMTPNVAVAGTLGAAAFIRGDHSSFTVAARPLGAASVVYFFR
jgi:hypothetical protein